MDPARERILAAAHRVFAEAGFRGATTRRIADVAGVNEVTLFRHFATKELLLTAAVDWHSDRVLAAMDHAPFPATPADLRRELTGQLLATLTGFLQGQQAIRTSFGEWGHHPALDRRLMRTTNHVYDAFERYLAAAREAGLIRPAVDIVVAAEVLLATIFADGMLRQVLPERFPLEPSPSVSAYLDIILDGLAPSAAGE